MTHSVSVSLTVSVSVSGSVTVTVSPTQSASLAPRPFTFANVLVSRVENIQNSVLNRVWIDEYSWDPVGKNKLATRVQSIHFPHRGEAGATGVRGPDPTRLTLPFSLSETEGMGQLVNSQDRCTVTIGGFDVGINDLTPGSSLFDAVTGYPPTGAGIAGTDFSPAGLNGYPMSLARFGNRGWSDYTLGVSTKYLHWLPKKGRLQYAVNSAAGSANVNNLVASDVYMRTLNDVPRAVAYTTASSLSGSAHANEVFYVTGHKGVSSTDTSSATYKTWPYGGALAANNKLSAAGSTRGRCWSGAFDYANNYPSSATTVTWLTSGSGSSTASASWNTEVAYAANTGVAGANYAKDYSVLPYSPYSLATYTNPGNAMFTSESNLAKSFASSAYSFAYSAGSECTSTRATNKAGCQCHNSDFISVDRDNTVGTTGLCFIGSSTSTEQRLLQVRKQPEGAIFGWPAAPPSATYDQTYTPSLVAADYDDGTSFVPASIASFANAPGSIPNAGKASPGGSSANFRNCAAKTASAAVVFDSASYVFWVEKGASDGYAIARSDFTGGAFGAPVPVWGLGRTYNTELGVAVSGGGATCSAVICTTAPYRDNDVVGIAFFDNGGAKTDNLDVLYAATLNGVFASVNAYAASAEVKWYLLAAIGHGEAQQFGRDGGRAIYNYGNQQLQQGGAASATNYLGSAHRGIAYAPRPCVSDGAVYRALGGDADAAAAFDAEEAAAQASGAAA